jgi:tRNA-dihydrouridine synthase B
MLPWFENGRRPLYLAPMAGVTDSVFRRLCKEEGADVLVTEFVSAEGILHRNQRTREMIEFQEVERPIGVQLFGAEPHRLAEATRAVLDWVAPDFVDLNFGCPVNKVVCRNGGSALLRDCPLLDRIARAVVSVAGSTPVTGKIRLGWDSKSINAVATSRILESAGVQAVAVHGRTKEQGYSGVADWDKIAEVAAALNIPVIGNGDICSLADIINRTSESGISGLMIGRAAMITPWIFRQAKIFYEGANKMPEFSLEQRWQHVLRHCRLAVAESADERSTMKALRGHLMAYSKAMPGGRTLRVQLQQVASLGDLESIATRHLQLSQEEELSTDSHLLCA